MPINQSHIKLIASKVMADVPEGGGGPSGAALVSGQSNNVFTDVTEADRAGGALSMRQLFLAIQSGDNDTALDCNLIISQPPTDPNVSVLLMATESDFATRAEDIAKLEAGYVASGAYNGDLYGNHIAGMQTVMLVQMPNTEPPVIGARLALVYHEGQGDEAIQYISVRRVVANVLQTFVDGVNQEYERRIITLELGQPLARAVPGFDAQRVTFTDIQRNARTRIRSTVWGNAARYYGVKKLTADAGIGDFTVQCGGIYDRVVPSAEAETPLISLRPNGQVDALLQAGTPTTFTSNATFDLGTGLAIGAAVTPGSLSITRGGATITDSGPRLMLAGAQVGTIDHANGLCVLTAAGFPTSGTLSVTYAPAMATPANLRSAGVPVTAQNRRLNYIFTLPAVCAPGSLQFHYRTGGRWYVLTEDGSGAIGGLDASHGAGTWSRATRTAAVTIGALPDVGSMVLITYGFEDQGSPVPLLHSNRVVIPILSNGALTHDGFSGAIEPGSLSLSWSIGASNYSATANSAGVISGDATGLVDHAAGRIWLVPDIVPPPGTAISVTLSHSASVLAGSSWTGSGASRSLALGEAVRPGTLRFSLPLDLQYTLAAAGYAPVTAPNLLAAEVTDDGAGHLVCNGVQVGTVTYASGAVTFDVTGVAEALALAAGMSIAVVRAGTTTVS